MPSQFFLPPTPNLSRLASNQSPDTNRGSHWIIHGIQTTCPPFVTLITIRHCPLEFFFSHRSFRPLSPLARQPLRALIATIPAPLSTHMVDTPDAHLPCPLGAANDPQIAHTCCPKVHIQYDWLFPKGTINRCPELPHVTPPSSSFSLQ